MVAGTPVSPDRGGLNLPPVSSNFDGHNLYPDMKQTLAASSSALTTTLGSGSNHVASSSADTLPEQRFSGSAVSADASERRTPDVTIQTPQPLKGATLVNDGSRVNKETAAIPPRISYADTVAPRPVRKPDIPLHRFHALKAIKHGESASLSIPRDLYMQQVSNFKFSLIGRLLLNKGDKPRSSTELKSELQRLWQPKAPWILMPMGKGYYTVKFHSKEDKTLVNARSSWELVSGQLVIREWVRNFNPYKATSSFAQIWVRIYYLPVEYWHPEIIAGIAGSLGQPLRTDAASLSGEVGHFVRVLVEMDLTQPILETLIIDGGDCSFSVEFSFENFPLYCPRCKIIGHSVEKCRKASKEQVVNDKSLGTAKETKQLEKKQHMAPKSKEFQWQTVEGRRSQHNNKFQVLDEHDEEQQQQLSGPDLLEKILVPVTSVPPNNAAFSNDLGGFLDNDSREGVLETVDSDDDSIDEEIEMENEHSLADFKGPSQDNEPVEVPQLDETENRETSSKVLSPMQQQLGVDPLERQVFVKTTFEKQQPPTWQQSAAVTQVEQQNSPAIMVRAEGQTRVDRQQHSSSPPAQQQSSERHVFEESSRQQVTPPISPADQQREGQ